MYVYSCGLILLCFIGLYAFAPYPAFSNSVLKSKLSAVPGWPKLSISFGARMRGREEGD